MELNNEQKNIIQNINKMLNNDKNNKILITGDICSGKTEIIKHLSSNLNVIIFNSENNNIFNFFNLSIINPYSTFSISINNQIIRINHNNFLDNNNCILPNLSDFNIIPHQMSYNFRKIFIPSKHIKNNKTFITYPNLYNNLIIIDNAENLERNVITFLDFNLRLLFDKEKEFGGINIILIGNKNKYITISSKLFNFLNYETSILHKFTVFNLSEPVIKLKKDILSLEDKINCFDLDIDRKNKICFNTTDSIFISHSRDFINKYNTNFLFKTYKKENIYKINSITEIEEKIFFTFNTDGKNYYINYYNDVLYISVGITVFFIKSIKDLNIKKGQIGIIDSIKVKKQRNNKEYCCDEVIVNVKIKNNIYKIQSESIICTLNKKEIYSKSQLPFVNIKYLDFKYLNFIPKKTEIIYVIDDINKGKFLKELIYKIKKKKLISFKNTIYLTDE